MNSRQRERFWKCVDVRSSEDCWPWKKSVNHNGYGQLSFRSDGIDFKVKAHRVAFMLTYGCWPDPMCLHRCDNPRCCNPEHLFVGDHDENMRDMVAKNRSARQLGSRCGASKLNECQVKTIRRMVESGAMQKTIAERLGISTRTISDIITRKTWRHV